MPCRAVSVKAALLLLPSHMDTAETCPRILETVLAASQLRQQSVLSSPVKECLKCGSCSLRGEHLGRSEAFPKEF